MFSVLLWKGLLKSKVQTTLLLIIGSIIDAKTNEISLVLHKLSALFVCPLSSLLKSGLIQVFQYAKYILKSLDFLLNRLKGDISKFL